MQSSSGKHIKEAFIMKKKNFVSMIMGTVGGILFAIGMCLCLLPQWNAFNQGIVMGAAGSGYPSSNFFLPPHVGRKSVRLSNP